MDSRLGRYTLRFTLVAAFAGITLLVSVVIGAATAHLVGGFVRDEFRVRLADLAAVAGSQIDVSQHHRLQVPSDQNSPAYNSLRTQLRAIRDRGTHIRFIYTMRQQADGQISFVIDGEENPAEFSALGDIYQEITPELLQAFAAPRGSKPSLVTERFYTDAWGTWMSAYAPLYLPDGRLDAVLGMDVSAERIVAHERRYQIAVWSACAALTLLFMPLAYLIAQRIRRPLSQLEADMRQVRQFNLGSAPNIRSHIIEINDMAQQLDNMKSGLRSFQKYVPADLVRRLMAQGVDAEIGGTQQEVTIFMSDIEGFTALSERLAPADLIRHLAEYLTAVTDCLLDTDATVDKYIGDAVLAFWNAPEPAPDHALRACRAALQSQKRITALNARWRTEGCPVAFKTRIGINSGEVIVGNIGSADRMSYTIIGDQVNLVSRLEAANKFYGTSILLSEHTRELVHTVFATRLIDQLIAYGKTVPIMVYELLGPIDGLDAEVRDLIERYEAAFEHHRRREFRLAMALLEQNPDDPPSQVLLERCRRYLIDPPPDGWDGSFMFTSK
jgi:class 3 adenylate cyclase